MDLLSLRNLAATVGGARVLGGMELLIGRNEIHAIMGPNGSGKSSLAMTILGSAQYAVRSGQIEFEGNDLMAKSADERARAGIYVAWQNPVTIPGLNVFTLCKTTLEARGRKVDSVVEFRQKVESLLVKVGLTKEHLGRGVNEGFSGGEKKRLELLQLLLLEPKLAILDEIDSGLDVDALRLVGKIVTEMRAKGTAFILITHYKRLLEYVKPDWVHVMKKGKIVRSGGAEVVEEIEEKGYGE